MKMLSKSSARGLCSLKCAIFLFSIFIASVAYQSQGQTYTLTHNNSVVQFDVLNGVSSWLVDGQNQLANQSLYYRIGGAGPEFPISNISATPTVTTTGTRQLEVLYANASYSVDVLYLLTGNTAGSGNSGVNATITFKNLNPGGTLDLNLFQYSDFDLGGVAGGQTVSFSQFNGHYNKATQTLGSLMVNNTFNSGFNFITHVEAAPFAQTLNRLVDGNPTTLNDVASFGPDDVTYTPQWVITLAAAGSAGDGLQISELISVQVPEPSILALSCAGLLAMAMLRRERAA